MALVSVIIPTYNRAYCVGRAIDSALRQTHPQVEVVVVDDGSTDGTGELVARKYGGDARVRYVWQENAGVSAARNAGLDAARGDFIALLDSDDTWKPWKIELQLACMARRPEVGMVWTDMEAVDPDGRVFEPRYLRTMYSAWSLHSADRLFGGAAIELRAIVPRLAGEVGDARFHSGVIFSQMIMGNHVHTSTVLLRRERVKAVGYFNTGFRYSGEDYDFHLRTCHQGPVGFLDVATIRYQRGMPDRLTRPEFRVHVAGNFLATILPWIRDRRQEIRLPAPMIRSVLGEAYAWLGEAQLDAGDHKGARRNLASGLRYGMHSRTALLLGASVLPPAWVAWLRAALRHVRPRPAR